MSVCDSSVVTAKSRIKHALYLANRFKSNFLALWDRYGSYDYVAGKKVFKSYRIDGNSDGAIRMSKLLRNPTLHTDVINDDVDSVYLFFDPHRAVDVTRSDIDAWINAVCDALSTSHTVRFHIANRDVVDAYFIDGNDHRIDNTILNDAAVAVAQKELLRYDADREDTIDIDCAYVRDMSRYGVAPKTHNLRFYVPYVEVAVQHFKVENAGYGDLFDALVDQGALFGSGGGEYYVSYDAVKKLNSFMFVKFVEKALSFDVNRSHRIWAVLLRILEFVVGTIAAMLGQWYIAGSIFVGMAAAQSDSEFLQIVSYALAIAGGIGSITSLADIGLDEALSLLRNVYGAFASLQSHRAVTSETDDDHHGNVQRLFYAQPYDAYDDSYCYDRYISV